MKNCKADTAVLVLAAGESRRMGQSKLFLKSNKGNIFAESIADCFRSFGITEIYYVINSDTETEFRRWSSKQADVKYVLNPAPERGRFYSFRCGAKALSNRNEYLFMHNADNPEISLSVLKALYEKRMAAEYLVPKFSGKGGHPILLQSKVLQAAVYEQNDALWLNRFLERFQRLNIRVNEPSVLLNINKPSDYSDYLAGYSTY